jgi:hypothetical protein
VCTAVESGFRRPGPRWLAWYNCAVMGRGNAAELGRRRGYLAGGPCPADTELLLKVVAAVGGLALCGVLQGAIDEGVIGDYHLKGGAALELRFADRAQTFRCPIKPARQYGLRRLASARHFLPRPAEASGPLLASDHGKAAHYTDHYTESVKSDLRLLFVLRSPIRKLPVPARTFGAQRVVAGTLGEPPTRSRQFDFGLPLLRRITGTSRAGRPH